MRGPSRRAQSVAAAVVLLALIGTAAHLVDDRLGTDPASGREQTAPTAPATPTGAPTAHGSFDRQRIEALLAAARVISKRPQVPGYERDCSPGSACSFGTAWTDDTSAPDGHNGCDTRNDVLGKTLQDVVFKPGTRDCKVVAGHFTDPYKGVEMDYATEGSQIQIDHLIPLAAAWDLGAAGWTQAERDRFANDTRYELLAVNGGANSSKGDSTPASWLPPNKPFRCEYVVRYLEAAAAYDLPLTKADAEVISYVARRC
jgi:hypothetical protein